MIDYYVIYITTEEIMTTKATSPISVRLPEKIRSWIKTKAKNNRRSMNAEFLLIIEDAMKKEEQDEKQMIT